MPVTDEVKKYADTARSQFVEQWTEAQKPLFAVVGAYDVAFEQTRQIPAQVRTLIEELPEQVKAFRGRVEGTATQLQDSTVTVYGELVERGERVYAQLRRQPTVQKAVETADKAGETVKQGGRDTSAAAKKALAKAADGVEETADSAAGTAKKATATAANTTKSVADKSKNAADKAVDKAEQATDDAAASAKKNA
jgi:heparin binding hemagglutinin HbhA